jgi:hypothetical protein
VSSNDCGGYAIGLARFEQRNDVFELCSTDRGDLELTNFITNMSSSASYWKREWKMITDSLNLKPMGGLYRNQYWPVDHQDIPELELHLGQLLPESYREFITTFGASCPAREMAVDLPDGTRVSFDQFRGAERKEQDYASVFAWVRHNPAPDRYPELMRYINFADATNGSFFLGPDGTIYYERRGFYELTWVAVSFDDFIQALYIDPDFADD